MYKKAVHACVSQRQIILHSLFPVTQILKLFGMISFKNLLKPNTSVTLYNFFSYDLLYKIVLGSLCIYVKTLIVHPEIQNIHGFVIFIMLLLYITGHYTHRSFLNLLTSLGDFDNKRAAWFGTKGTSYCFGVFSICMVFINEYIVYLEAFRSYPDLKAQELIIVLLLFIPIPLILCFYFVICFEIYSRYSFLKQQVTKNPSKLRDHVFLEKCRILHSHCSMSVEYLSQSLGPRLLVILSIKCCNFFWIIWKRCISVEKCDFQGTSATFSKKVLTLIAICFASQSIINKVSNTFFHTLLIIYESLDIKYYQSLRIIILYNFYEYFQFYIFSYLQASLFYFLYTHLLFIFIY